MLNVSGNVIPWSWIYNAENKKGGGSNSREALVKNALVDK